MCHPSAISSLTSPSFEDEVKQNSTGKSIPDRAWCSIDGGGHQLKTWTNTPCHRDPVPVWTVIFYRVRNGKGRRTSLGAQWIRTHLPMQGMQVRSLVQKNATCLGATKLVHHSYWTRALRPGSLNYLAHGSQLLKSTCFRACALQQEKPPQGEARALQRRVAASYPN